MATLSRAKELGDRFLKTLPDVSLAFGYGSGVFSQPDLSNQSQRSGERPLIDFILAVENTSLWHQHNIKANRQHYAGLAQLGPRWVEFLSSAIGVGVHFNTYVPFEKQIVKYGIMSVEALKLDLLTWRHLYVSGRLHKPVLWIRKPTSSLNEALCRNHQAALASALLLSPRSFTKQDLFYRICGLSYTGDVRMHVAEDSSKIHRIVAGSFQQLDALYRPLLQSCIGEVVDMDQREDVNQTITIDDAKKCALLSFLPTVIRLQRLTVTSDGLCLVVSKRGGLASQNRRERICKDSVGDRHQTCFSFKQMLYTVGVKPCQGYWAVAGVSQHAISHLRSRKHSDQHKQRTLDN